MKFIFLLLFLPSVVFGQQIYGDCDCNKRVDVSDITYLINYIFGAGPAPGKCAYENDLIMLTNIPTEFDVDIIDSGKVMVYDSIGKALFYVSGIDTKAGALRFNGGNIYDRGMYDIEFTKRLYCYIENDSVVKYEVKRYLEVLLTDCNNIGDTCFITVGER